MENDTATNQDQIANQAKVEEKNLTRDEQVVATDRAARQMRYPGESNLPDGEAAASPSAARLRAFEDERFGKDCVRLNGQIEKGSGSPYAAMQDHEKLQYTALERLIVAEQKLADANAIAAQAAADRDVAEAHVADCEKMADEAASKKPATV